MPDPVPSAAHPSPPAMEIPSFKAPDVQLLVQDLAQSRRDLFEERKNSGNRLAEERERSRWEIERVRTEMGAQIKGFNFENEALIRAIGRLQKEIDHLREDNAVLRHVKLSGAPGEERGVTPEKTSEKQDVVSSMTRVPMKSSVPLVMPAVPAPGVHPVMPRSQVMGPFPTGGGGQV